MKLSKASSDTTLKVVALTASAVLVLSACSDASEDGGEGEGFDYGAPQEEVDGAIEDLEPVTITYQPSAASQNSVRAPDGLAFKERVEERSNGQITVDVVWGQAIAGYDEVEDALADGRVDIAYTLPLYKPDEFPTIDDIGRAMSEIPHSPQEGELLRHAVAKELAWSNDELLAEYEDKGLTPLNPLENPSTYHTLCTEPIDQAEDWSGLTIRTGSSAHSELVTDLGGTPTSVEYTETYEALQRGAFDCTLAELMTMHEQGLYEIAPYLSYHPDGGFPGYGAGYIAGSSFQEMPLAYQQIIFDSNALMSADRLGYLTLGNAEVIRDVRESGGEVSPYTESVQDAIDEAGNDIAQDAADNGRIDEDTASTIADLTEKWTQKIEDLGHADQGPTAEFDEWFDPEADYEEFVRATYEEGEMMNHRPN